MRPIALMIALSLSGPVEARAQEPAAPAWVPDAAKVASLAPEASVKGDPAFVVRPPKGYESQPLTGASAFVSRGVWSMPPRADGTGSGLLVMIGRRKPGERPTAPKDFIPVFFRAREKQVGPMTFGGVERGRIGDLTFDRVRWAAKHPTTGVQSYGFLYYATPGDLDIMLDGQDVAPHAAESLPIAEAAAQTFRLDPR